jgi:hypothetical protein
MPAKAELALRSPRKGARLAHRYQRHTLAPSTRANQWLLKSITIRVCKRAGDALPTRESILGVDDLGSRRAPSELPAVLHTE